jgi:hypothetical protein
VTKPSQSSPSSSYRQTPWGCVPDDAWRCGAPAQGTALSPQWPRTRGQSHPSQALADADDDDEEAERNLQLGCRPSACASSTSRMLRFQLLTHSPSVSNNSAPSYS